MKEPSTKATIVAFAIWGCICYTGFKVLTPILGETIVGILGIGAFVMLWWLLPMCQSYFDRD